ncbi:MAG TPA: CaiB/BaiF CoA-transferase family protein [Acidimicrobiia bacterium]|nr:CaiB/BaiF CoA-transferase family protein [Acidimicrobiia bacterium]
MTGLLEGVTVVETGVLMTVDHLGRLLADEGADVVKVESPGQGDYLRNIMTRFAPDWSTFHLALNRNKRSLTCDARTPEGREVLSRLLDRADIFITGNIGDTNRKLGLDEESVRAIRPEIVYCQATGFGASGPYAQVPTHGQMMDALGGGAPPMALDDDGFVVATGDAVGGSGGVVIGPLYAAFGVACALARARLTGEGCYLDVSCADAVLCAKWLDAIPMLNPELVDRSWDGKAPGESAKYQHYETADGKYVLFCAIETKFWEHWCTAVGRDDLLREHRADLVVDFAGGDDALRREIQQVFHTKTQDEWMKVAVEDDIALGPALRFDEVGEDPHLQARGQIVLEEHPLFGEMRTLGNPVLVPGEEFTVRSAPVLGQHTDEVLEELGYDAPTRARLHDLGVV